LARLSGEELAPRFQLRRVQGVAHRPDLEDDRIQVQRLTLVEDRDQFRLLPVGGQAGLRRPVDVGDGRDPDAAELARHLRDRRLLGGRHGRRDRGEEAEAEGGDERGTRHGGKVLPSGGSGRYAARYTTPSRRRVTAMIHVIATIELVPGTRDAFLAEFRKVTGHVRGEPGCIEYGAAVDLATSIPVQEPAGDDA